MRKRAPMVEAVGRDMLECIAGIVGPASAAALILRDADEHFGSGAQFWRVDNSFVCGPAGAPPPRQDKPERRTIPCDKGMAINAGNGRHRWRLGVCEYCGRKRTQVVEYI